MTLLSVSLTLCTLLSLSPAVPLNSTSKSMGLCEHAKKHDDYTVGEFVPHCDDHGNFLPQQCLVSTGYCWCVDVTTGNEIPNTRTPPGSVTVNCGDDTYMDYYYYCPAGWSRFGKRCFIFIDSPKSWAEAEGYCLFEGANLASIHSYEENHFVQALTRGYTYDFPETWIGGQDAIHHCFWMWSDGSRFHYGDWYMDYDMKRTEHCLKMNYGYEWKWNYASCNETLPFVCVKRIISYGKCLGYIC